MSDLEGMVQLKDWDEKVPSKGQLRAWLRENRPGIVECFHRVGALTLVNKAAVFEWIKKQKYTTKAPRKGPSPLKGRKKAEATEDSVDLL